MINKSQYLELLQISLREHYDIMKTTNKIFPDRQNFIDGYLTAAYALEAFDPKELKKHIENLHLEIFGITVAERQKTISFEIGTADDYLEVPAYIRKGVGLEF